MKSLVTCRFCYRVLDGEVQYHPGDRNVYCNETCYALFQHSDTYTLPEYPKENPPFVGDLDHADINTDRGGQRIMPDMGERRKHD